MVGLFLQNMSDPFARAEAGQDHVDYTQFGGARAFDTMGFADSDGAANGRAGTQEVDGNKLEAKELLREKSEKRDKTNELMELGFSMREAHIANVTYSNGQFHMFGKSIDEEDMDAQVDETLKNIDSIADRHNLSGQDKVELTTLLMAYQQAETPQEKAEVLTKIAEKSPEVGREIAQDAASKSEIRKQSELTNDEEQDSISVRKENPSEVKQEQQQFAEQNGYSSIEAANLAEKAVAITSNKSVGDNPFANISNVSSEFNSNASGIEVAEIAPQNIAEAQINAPVLSNG